jgi:hypothetical protein
MTTLDSCGYDKARSAIARPWHNDRTEASFAHSAQFALGLTAVSCLIVAEKIAGKVRHFGKRA